MPIDPRIRQCDQIKSAGNRCGSPAMRGALKCYFHLRPARIDDFRVTSLTDPIQLQKAVTEIFNAVATNKLDVKRASALLYAIQVSKQKLG
jgi:hypothetical protein